MGSDGSPVYFWALIAGVAIGGVYWYFQGKDDARIPMVYLGGLVGAFLGAKAAFLLAEGWLYDEHPQRWQILASGKSVMGALPGGWAGVEITKRFLGYEAVTGDRFARLIPLPLILGRLGCLDAGCCQGIHGWPAVPVEIGFQMLAWSGLLVLKVRRVLPGQHFHLYVIAYGGFRFSHEFLRATPKVVLGLSGYQWIALATVVVGWMAFRRRAAMNSLRPGDAAT